MSIKKVLALILVAVLALSVFTACGDDKEEKPSKKQESVPATESTEVVSEEESNAVLSEEDISAEVSVESVESLESEEVSDKESATESKEEAVVEDSTPAEESEADNASEENNVPAVSEGGAPNDSDVEPEPNDSDVEPEPNDSDVEPEPNESDVEPEPNDSSVTSGPNESDVEPEPDLPRITLVATENDDETVTLSVMLPSEIGNGKVILNVSDKLTYLEGTAKSDVQATINDTGVVPGIVVSFASATYYDEDTILVSANYTLKKGATLTTDDFWCDQWKLGNGKNWVSSSNDCEEKKVII